MSMNVCTLCASPPQHKSPIRPFAATDVMTDTAAGPSTATNAAASGTPSMRTTYRRQASFEPSYTGGASTAITADARYFIAPVNDTIHITSVRSGNTVARIPSDMEDVTSLSLTPDQATLIIASRSMALRVVELRFPVDDGNADEKDRTENTDSTVSWSLQRTIAKAHDAPIVVMQVDPTSTLLATGSSDTCAKVWDIRGGFCTHVFRGHGGIVSSLAWNMPAVTTTTTAAGRRIELLTGSIDGRVRVWDLKAARTTGGSAGAKPTAVLDSHFSVVRGLAVSRDGQKIVTAGRDRMVGLWERGKGGAQRSSKSGDWQLVSSVTAGESLESAGFLLDDDTFWTAGAEGEVRLWSFSRRAIIRMQPGGRFARGTATQRSISKGEEEEDEGEDENETRAVTEVHWLRSANQLATVHADQDVIFRSCDTLQRLRQLAGFNDQIIDAALLSPSTTADSHLAVATNSTYIRVYTLGTQQHTVDVLPNEADADNSHTGLILCLDKTSDGKWLASGGKDRSVRIWAWVAQREDIAKTADGDDIGMVVDGADASAPLTHKWRCVAIAEGHTESVGAVAFARRAVKPGQDGAPFLVTGSQDRTAKVWDLSKLPKHIASAASSSSFKPLKLSSLNTLKIHDKDINALDVSPNNALLLSGSQDKTAKVFAIQYQAPSKANAQTASASLKLVKTCQGHKRGVWSVAFSPSDAVFLTGSSDRTMKLWSINDGFACVKSYVGHTNSVLRVRFLKGSNGLQCLSCASDGLVKVWNVRTEECLDTLDGHDERVWGLDCTQSGDVLVSGGADGMIRFWHDWTERQATEQFTQRQHDVEQEQAFGNLLAVRDYRNAISLALTMKQPRRLLQLFQTVDQQRTQGGGGGDASNATGALLRGAIEKNNGGKVSSLRDPALAQVLARAGVLPSSAMAVSSAATTKTASITGSTAVDEVVASLKPTQLTTLLTFVRDWNTTVRTANVAQTVLHAILRFHSAESIIDAFDAQVKRAGSGGGGAEEEETTDVAPPPTPARGRRGKDSAAADLGNVLDALLPYTRRHYDRAQRILTESAMLEYTLANMDALLGPDEAMDAASEWPMLQKNNGRVQQHATVRHEDKDINMDDEDDESVESDE